MAVVDFLDSCKCQDQKLASRLAEAKMFCTPLRCFGTTYLRNHVEISNGVHDIPITPDTVANLNDVAGSVVFDTWIYNQDARHFLGQIEDRRWRLFLFDNDGAFNRRDWILHNNVREDLNCTALQNWVRGQRNGRRFRIFESYLQTLEDNSMWKDLPRIAGRVPEVWISRLPSPQRGLVGDLLARLDKRRSHVRQILQAD
jgi:hypothetical protein